MELPAKLHQDQLPRIKKQVKQAYDYFKHNYDRFNEYRRFVYESSLRPEDITLLMTLSKPQLEFNILEAYASRLLGEFSKQQPDIMVSADDINVADPLTIRIVEAHLRHELTDTKNHHTKYEIYKDLLSGGFSVGKISTDYANPMSFHQVIKIERVYDPTLCGFDQLARYSHKGDGRFCFELFPMAKDNFKEEFPDINIDNVSFTRSFSGFNWSYLNDNTPTVIVCDYYEKKKKRVQIVQLTDKRVMTMKEYKKLQNNWLDITQIPGIVGKPRWTELETICRYRVIENTVIEYEETDYTMFPLVFFDGNSMLMKTPKNGNVRQVCRPYFYHAKGAQRFKNFAGISWANELENIVQHKVIISKEALPKEEEWLQAYKDVQKPSNYVYNAFDENDPNKVLAPPVPVQRVPMPQEIAQGFAAADGLIQQILGSYDAALGINDNQLSGVAVVEAATQSNSAAMPYIVGFMQGYQRLAEIFVDLMPKYYTTPRTIPIMDEEGKRSFVEVNNQGQPNMFFDANALNVKVEAGASFQVQKSKTLMMVKEIMGMSPLFAQFIADKGLSFVLDNLEGRGIDQLKQMVTEWQQEMEQQKQMAMAQQQQNLMNNPVMIKAQLEKEKMAQDAQKQQTQFAIDMEKLKQAERKVIVDAISENKKNEVQMLKSETERFAKSVDLMIKKEDMRHKHLKDAIDLHAKTFSKEPEGEKTESI